MTDPEHDFKEVEANRDQDGFFERWFARLALAAILFLIVWSLI